MLPNSEERTQKKVCKIKYKTTDGTERTSFSLEITESVSPSYCNSCNDTEITIYRISATRHCSVRKRGSDQG